MADFKQAIEWLKEGKKVRRKNDGWFIHGKNMLMLFKTETKALCAHQEFSIADFEATDWEIYEESSGEILRRLGTDGTLWAKEFMKLFENKRYKIDEGLMICWFCNAIEAGRSAR